MTNKMNKKGVIFFLNLILNKKWSLPPYGTTMALFDDEPRWAGPALLR